MSPFHSGFVRQLHTTTALQCSAAWLVSENVLEIRRRRAELDALMCGMSAEEIERCARSTMRLRSGSLQKEIDGAILLSEVKPIIERMN